jgi:hypothetical protein
MRREEAATFDFDQPEIRAAYQCRYRCVGMKMHVIGPAQNGSLQQMIADPSHQTSLIGHSNYEQAARRRDSSQTSHDRSIFGDVLEDVIAEYYVKKTVCIWQIVESCLNDFPDARHLAGSPDSQWIVVDAVDLGGDAQMLRNLSEAHNVDSVAATGIEDARRCLAAILLLLPLRDGFLEDPPSIQYYFPASGVPHLHLELIFHVPSVAETNLLGGIVCPVSHFRT